MSEIKFRAWDDTEKCWRYETVKDIYNSISLGDTSACDVGEHCSEIFCLFTGLLDKNGKEIYEGDIVHLLFIGKDGVAEGNYEIKYSSFGYEPFNVYGIRSNIVSYEVIGNIYENQELLKSPLDNYCGKPIAEKCCCGEIELKEGVKVIGDVAHRKSKPCYITDKPHECNQIEDLLDIIWKQISRYTIIAHQNDSPDDEHIYSICGIINKRKLEEAIQAHNRARGE